jgi:hypothetical protein
MDSIKPNTRQLPSQTGLDIAINTFNSALLTLPWLQHAFAIAKTSKEFIGDNEVVFPECFLKAGRYTNLMTNRDYKTFSFFQLNDPFSPQDYASGERDYYKKYNVSLIVQVDLYYIDKDKEYDFTNELINDVLQIAQNLDGFNFVNAYREFDNVWAGYSLNQANSQAQKYPNDSFKIDFELINVTEPC